MLENKINKYKVKNNYPEKLDKFIKGLDNKLIKELENGDNINR
tara:strand:+ start:320 stop:448 length:129 start_codon:yes stop_codon:yes gene_type:complete